jgi:predicted nucleic acid-binding protein
MYILFDTNILFSSFIADGNEKYLVEKVVSSSDTLVVTDLIIQEMDRLFTRKLSRNRASYAKKLFERLCKSELSYIKPANKYRRLIPEAQKFINEKDAPILAAGLQKEIDMLVSGDSDFIKNPKLSFLRREKIFTAKEALDAL